MKQEEWRDVPGFEGLYKVSNLGNVMCVGGGRGREPFKQLRQIAKNGYLYVHLRNGDISCMSAIHRIVCAAFIPNPEHKPQVNHKDGIRTNNVVSNLEWVTASENAIHAYKNLPRKPFSHFHSVKLTETQVVEIFKSDEPTSVLMSRYGVSDTMIYRIKKKKAWKQVTECL